MCNIASKHKLFDFLFCLKKPNLWLEKALFENYRKNDCYGILGGEILKKTFKDFCLIMHLSNFMLKKPECRPNDFRSMYKR